MGLLAWAARGPACDAWTPPAWLLPHQLDAARRVAGALDAFSGAILADATGLGKTYVALAVAGRYRAPIVLAPASLIPQWRRTAARVGTPIRCLSLERVSRDPHIPHGDLVVIDEAHHMRNPATRRYDAVCRRVSRTPVLLLTATPVARGPRDLLALLRLFVPDNGLALLGVPSLEGMIAARRYADVARAAAVVSVARTPLTLHPFSLNMPRPDDVRCTDTATLPVGLTGQVLQAIDGLAFPGAAGDVTAAGLLRTHLVHRLNSSVAALRETIDRHAAYVRRAIESGCDGQPLPRNAARALLGPEDDAQLSFDLATSRATVDLSSFAAERERLAALRLLLRVAPGRCEKSEQLARLLAERQGHKTIVFTTARATAMSLAAELGWTRLAVVCSDGATVASGRAPLEDVLAWFAPRARDATPPSDACRVDTLIATDLVSEGLDLQDADAIVHYDLPWTPLRLTQRLGRIARLGTSHDRVRVWWFLPPPALDARLRITSRLTARSFAQRRLGADAPRRVGVTTLTNGVLHWRERLAAQAAGGRNADTTGWTRVSGTGGAFALHWLTGRHLVPEVVVLERPAGAALADASLTWTALVTGAAVPKGPPQEWIAALHALVRSRLSAAAAPAAHHGARLLTHALHPHARRAAAQRDAALLARLDAVLTRVHMGLSAGAERQLADILRARPHASAFDRWLESPAPASPLVPRVRLCGALLGDLPAT